MSYRIAALYFEATRLCNLQCRICMAGSNDAQRVRDSRARELDLDEIRDLVLAPARRLGTLAVAWSGGEFLLRADALDLLRLTVDMGFQCKLCSNGEILTRERLLAVKEATRGGITISLGLNTFGPDNADTRDAPPDHVLAALALCKELKINRHVIITIGKHNAETFAQTVQGLRDMGVTYNRSPLVARGSACEFFRQHAFDREDMERYFHPTLRSQISGYGSYTPFFLSPELYEQVSGGIYNGTVPCYPPVGCWAGSTLSVNAEGDVSLCPVLLDAVSAGNVRDKPLDRVVNESPVMARLLDRTQLKGRCGRCRYRTTCGGCRAMAFFHTGDFMEEDPTCFFEPVDPTTVSEYEAQTNRLFKKVLVGARYIGGYTGPIRRGPVAAEDG